MEMIMGTNYNNTINYILYRRYTSHIRILGGLSANLLLYGILVESVNNLLKFDVKTTNNPLRYTITNGKSSIPGLDDYRITKKKEMKVF
jgi:hypothetical protein